ncbi:hypothetical protein BGZ89_002631, partial [Linnemannia elongata]
MNNNPLTLFCLVDGEATSQAFPVEIESTKTTGNLKQRIKTEKTPRLDDVASGELTLWRVSIPDDNLSSNVKVDALDGKTQLNNPRTQLSKLFPASPDANTYILVQRPQPEPDLPVNKKIRITEGWRQYTASDGKVVDLPSSWIGILANTKFEPKPRAAFDHLKDNLRVGDAIIVPSMGQTPKMFGRHDQGHRLFVTEQMLELWEDMRGHQEFTCRRVLSGPMGVGKS